MIGKLKIIKASIKEKAILRNMLEFYLYDLSPFIDADLNPSGKFGYPYLEQYWQEENRHPFLVKIEDKYVGFVLVNNKHYSPQADYSVAEFFVMKKYRCQGIGKDMAFYIFEQFQGTWEVRVLPQNTEAILFWLKLIREYTSGNFKEITNSCDKWAGPIFTFTNRPS